MGRKRKAVAARTKQNPCNPLQARPASDCTNQTNGSREESLCGENEAKFVQSVASPVGIEFHESDEWVEAGKPLRRERSKIRAIRCRPGRHRIARIRRMGGNRKASAASNSLNSLNSVQARSAPNYTNCTKGWKQESHCRENEAKSVQSVASSVCTELHELHEGVEAGKPLPRERSKIRAIRCKPGLHRITRIARRGGSRKAIAARTKQNPCNPLQARSASDGTDWTDFPPGCVCVIPSVNRATVQP